MRAIQVLAFVGFTFGAGLLSEEASADPASAPDLHDYVVRPGDTCASIAARTYGDSKRVDLIHDNNPGMGPPPHTLKAGTVLHLPPKPDAKNVPDAKVSFVRNEVNAFTPEAHAAHVQDPLVRGNRVDTEANSSAEVTFADETRMQLGEHTLVVILGSDRAKTAVTGTASDTTLMSGSLRAHLSELAGPRSAPVAIATGSGTKVLVDGGDVLLNVDEAQTARLAVHRGKSTLRASGREVSVAEGFGSKAEKNKPPTPPRPLPAAPVWSTSPPEIVFADGATVDVTAAYAPGPGVEPATWHVQIARDESFNALVVDERVKRETSELSARSLGEGAYFMRVGAIDADKFEGKPSAVAHVVVVAPKVTAAPAGQLGRLAVPASLLCAVDGAPPELHASGELEVSRARPHRLRCTTHADGTGGVETSIAPSRVGDLRLGARLVGGDATTRRGRLSFTLADATGAPLAGAALVATSPSATFEAVNETRDAGTYEAVVQWGERTPSFVATVRVNGLEDASADAVVTPAEPAASLLPAPSASRYAATLGVMGGVGTNDDFQVGAALGLELGVHRAIPAGSVGVALRARYESYARTTTGTCGAPLPCASTGTSPYAYDASSDALTLEVPLTLSLGARTDRLSPYVGIAPGVLFDRTVLAPIAAGPVLRSTEQAARFSFHGFAGLELGAGPGHFFLEAGYREATSERRATGESRFRSFLGEVGYRLTL